MPARFGWAVKAAEDRAAEGVTEGEAVGEEAQPGRRSGRMERWKVCGRWACLRWLS